MQNHGLHHQVVRYDIGFGIEGDSASEIAVEVYWPEQITRPQVLFCVPGGGMNRRYFDLGGKADSRFSFARQMAARGFVSVLVDPPALGDSDRPEDGHALTPALITRLLAQVHARVMDDLGAGAIDGHLAAMHGLISVGVGHSMGAMLTVLQQATHQSHDAVVLLGFGTRGLPQFLPPQARPLLENVEAWRAALPTLAKSAFPASYPVLHSDGGEAGLFGSTHADPAGVKALKSANDVMLPVPALMSLFPGNVAPECADIRVPIYLGIGERDMVGEPEKVPASFPASRDVTLQVLPQTGHSHFLFPAREQLFDGIADWAAKLESTPG